MKTNDLVAACNGFKDLDGVYQFPAIDLLGLDSEADKPLIAAVARACEANRQWAERGDNSAAYGELNAMLEFGVVDGDTVHAAIHRARKIMQTSGPYVNPVE
jgi:hypothetical protein